MIDCNCHMVFDSLWANRASIWQQARAAGLISAVVSAEQITPLPIQQLQDCEQAGLFPAIGWHPLFPRPADAIEQLAQVLNQHPRWGVGEVVLILESFLTTAKQIFCLSSFHWRKIDGQFCMPQARVRWIRRSGWLVAVEMFAAWSMPSRAPYSRQNAGWI